jgi:predicted dehydrogenase
MAATLAIAEAMVAACSRAGVPFVVHENWRWQLPIRQLKRVLDDLAKSSSVLNTSTSPTWTEET